MEVKIEESSALPLSRSDDPERPQTNEFTSTKAVDTRETTSANCSAACGCEECQMRKSEDHLRFKPRVEATSQFYTILPKFWMVTRVDGLGWSPKKKHSSPHDANEEAKRLARKEHGVEFHVVEALTSYKTPADIPLEQVRYDGEGE